MNVRFKKRVCTPSKPCLHEHYKQIQSFHSHTGIKICILVATGEGFGVKTFDWYLLKHRAVILVPPDEDLCDGADSLHEKISVVVCHCGVFGQDMVHIPDGET